MGIIEDSNLPSACRIFHLEHMPSINSAQRLLPNSLVFPSWKIDGIASHYLMVAIVIKGWIEDRRIGQQLKGFISWKIDRFSIAGVWYVKVDYFHVTNVSKKVLRSQNRVAATLLIIDLKRFILFEVIAKKLGMVATFCNLKPTDYVPFIDSIVWIPLFDLLLRTNLELKGISKLSFANIIDSSIEDFGGVVFRIWDCIQEGSQVVLNRNNPILSRFNWVGEILKDLEL